VAADRLELACTSVVGVGPIHVTQLGDVAMQVGVNASAPSTLITSTLSDDARTATAVWPTLAPTSITTVRSAPDARRASLPIA
ncbi:MAG: hypothetical protein JWM84_347, partial [Nocardioides sp.]|nr:hypothetical protein [Nocardioides sp.]